MATKVEGWTFEAEGPDRILWHEPQSTRGGTEAVKATLVIGEKSFTESEVRAMLRAIRHELEMNVRWQDHVEVVSASAMRQAFHRSDVLSLDPA